MSLLTYEPRIPNGVTGEREEACWYRRCVSLSFLLACTQSKSPASFNSSRRFPTDANVLYITRALHKRCIVYHSKFYKLVVTPLDYVRLITHCSFQTRRLPRNFYLFISVCDFVRYMEL